MRARVTNLLAVVAVVALAGCSGTSATSPAAPSADPSTGIRPSTGATVTPVTSPVPTSDASAPVATPAAVETPAPAPSVGASTTVAPELVARLTVYPDVYAGPVPPTVSIYADGHVLTPPPTGPVEPVMFVVRRLTSDGLARVLAEFDAALSAFGKAAATPDPSADYGGGYNTYVLSVRRGDRLVSARATSPPTSEPAIVDLGERWLDVATVLPSDAWLDAMPSAFVATHWSLWLRPSSAPTGPVADASVLRASVGDLATFGAPTEGSLPDARCGVLDRATVEALTAALETAGLPKQNVLNRFDVTVGEVTTFTDVTLVPALPDQSTGCPPLAP